MSDTILAAIDFSDVTHAVLERATTLATGIGGQLVLLHVADPHPDFVGFEVGPQNVRDQVAEELREEHRAIQELAQRCNNHVPTTARLVAGPVVETILREANDNQATWIVVGSHGHGALYELLVGSVSEGVLRSAICPVVIVPTHAE